MHYRDEYFQFLPYHHDECKLSLNVPVQSTGPYAIQNTRNAISDALTTVMTEGVLKQLKALKHTRAQFALFLFSADNRSLFQCAGEFDGAYVQAMGMVSGTIDPKMKMQARKTILAWADPAEKPTHDYKVDHLGMRFSGSDVKSAAQPKYCASTLGIGLNSFENSILGARREKLLVTSTANGKIITGRKLQEQALTGEIFHHLSYHAKNICRDVKSGEIFGRLKLLNCANTG